MKYIPLTEHHMAWIFNRADLPLSDDDRAAIKPLVVDRARQLWGDMISRQVDHPDFFSQGDWAFSLDTWQDEGSWEGIWDSNQAELPDGILEHLQWDDNTVVFYCNDHKKIIETSWGVFKRCWKNFLFMDDGALLVGRRRQQVVQFLSNGRYRIGTRPQG